MNIKKILKNTTIMALFAIVFIIPLTAHAAAPTDPWEIFTSVVVPVLSWVGIVMFIFGAFEMGFAFRSDEAEGKRKGLLVVMSGAVLFVVCTYISTLNSATFNKGTDIPLDPIMQQGVDTPQMQTLLTQLATWIPMLGGIVMCWGIFELIKALKSDDAGGKQKALTIIISGVALIMIIELMKWVLWGIPF